MIRKVKEILVKYREIILYAVFGALATLINLLSYHLLYRIIGISNVLSTAIAWILAVVFAFITNKLWVFNSKSFEKQMLLHEMITFFGARAATGVLDIGIMYVAVDVMHWDATVWKLISNVIVIIINYVASKKVIFKKKLKKTEARE